MLNNNASLASTASYAASDMLHRRVPLPYLYDLPFGDSTIAIATDSLLIGEALFRVTGSIVMHRWRAGAEWEITVEAQDEGVAFPAEEVEQRAGFYDFGPSRSLRLENGSWFAHTPPSISGIGFAFVSGSKSRQVMQIARYLKMILAFVGDSADPATPSAEGGGAA